MDLNEIKVFVKVAQAGSFTQAAAQLGMPNSTVSAKVSALEKRLGVVLLQRTTRKLRLTHAGEIYFEQCLQGLTEIQAAEHAVSLCQQEAQGTLRVTAPVDMGNTCLVGLIGEFSKKYPKVDLEFLFTDRVVDLVAEGVDIGIRAGELKDSGLVARKLGVAYWAVHASPAYLKKHPPLSHPHDLSKHTCLQFTPLGEESWQLRGEKHSVAVRLNRHLVLNDLALVKALTLGGAGIALLPTFNIQTEISAGKLVRVLPQWRANADPVHLIYPRQKYIAPKVRAFADLAVETFKSFLPR